MTTDLAAPKICSRCKAEKTIDSFHRDARREDGRTPWCRECKREVDAETMRDPVGFLTIKHRAMSQRANGTRNANRQTNSWIGKGVLPRDAFIAWSLACDEFWELFEAWLTAGRPRRLNPSIDRLDTGGGPPDIPRHVASQAENSARRPQVAT